MTAWSWMTAESFGGTYGWGADASPDDESIGVLGTLGLTGDGLTSAQRKQAILESFATCFGPEALDPTAYVEHDWGRRPTRKAASRRSRPRRPSREDATDRHRSAGRP